MAEGISPVAARAEYRNDRVPSAATARINMHLNSVAAWSPESPALYTLTATLIAPDGNECDFEGVKVGFKDIRIQGGVLYMNCLLYTSRPVLIRVCLKRDNPQTQVDFSSVQGINPKA